LFTDSSRKANDLKFRRGLSFERLEDRRFLAVLTVDTPLDKVDFADGLTSLREAIFAANLVEGPDTIEFDIGQERLEIINLSVGELKITDALTIDGSDANFLVIDASSNDPTPMIDDGKGVRIFNIDDGSPNDVEVTIRGLWLTGGDSGPSGGALLNRENLTVDRVLITSNFSRENGGGIASVNGTLTVSESTIEENAAQRGGGVHSSGGAATFDSTELIKNKTTSSGGGIFAANGNLVLIDSLVSGNAASGTGGGIYHFGQASHELSISGTQVIANSVAQANLSNGGGIHKSGFGPTSIVNGVVLGNSATGDGCGLYITGSSTQIVDTRFSDNTAGRNGAGVYLHANELNVMNSTFDTNDAGGSGGGAWFEVQLEATIDRSVFRANTAGGSGGGVWLTRFVGRGATSDTGERVLAGLIEVPAPKLWIRRTTIRDNSAAASGGGALLAGPFGIRVAESTISGNMAGIAGGGFARYVTAFTSGGAELLTSNATISGNQAKGVGGGVFVQPTDTGTVGLALTTMTANISDSDHLNGGAGGGIFVSRGTLHLDQTIVAANTDNSGIGPDLSGFLGAQLEPRFSLIGTNVGTGLVAAPANTPDAEGNLIGGPTTSTRINPRLSSLANNGGPTRTHALLADSPAINHGDPAAQLGEAGVPTSDQRISPFIRVYGGRIDIGAFERQPAEVVLGDFNGNGIVDGADYAMWRRATGATDPLALVVDARGNGDGRVDTRTTDCG
jgi:predicted outer membrane repeat protein